MLLVARVMETGGYGFVTLETQFSSLASLLHFTVVGRRLQKPRSRGVRRFALEHQLRKFWKFFF